MNKYHNKVTYQGGEKFDSKKEYQRYKDLCILQKAGVISSLERQKPFVLIDKSEHGRMIKYIADFVYIDEESGKMIIEDVKSTITKKNGVYRLKKRLFEERYGLKITEV
jgi:hypothetical protein